MTIPPIGTYQPFNNNNDDPDPSKLIERKILEQKSNSCWQSSEPHFKPKETIKEVKGTDSFASNNENPLEDISFEDAFKEDEPGDDLVDSYKLKAKIKAEKTQFESENTQLKISTQIESQNEKKNLGDLLKNKLNSLDCVYQSVPLFKEDVGKLQEKISDSPEKKDELVDDFIREALDEGKIGRLENGNFVPLNEKEKEKLKEELKSFFKDYFVSYPPITKRQSEEKPLEKETVDHHAKFKRDPDSYTLAIYVPNRRVFSDAWQIEVIVKVQEIILAAIIKHGQKNAEEKRTLEKIDRLIQILSADILKSEILKNEIKLQDIKFQFTKTINIPIQILVKLTNLIKNSNKFDTETAFRILPGLHKITSLASKVNI